MFKKGKINNMVLPNFSVDLIKLHNENNLFSLTIQIASNMLKAQQVAENEEANAQMQKGATNQMMAEFDTLTEIISDKTDPNSLWKLAKLISNKCDLAALCWI